ncbi:hypothetical protein TRV_00040 [Trichophyton verrucosum HKI 0517]|uniref:Uncharacterized protein n=1 Tax=Trichophyton verrucosum (strain HKI 0517) TaxID=663202 RepID=D4CZ03_TRIVH|nr:uncharacterized protein TRV_00040 [Trichophyton verrucosum HKI 0517]EFE45167.1 hypothetical protein TRV_00040 [Trichophyton verrucosum HKI 0517]
MKVEGQRREEEKEEGLAAERESDESNISQVSHQTFDRRLLADSRHCILIDMVFLNNRYKKKKGKPTQERDERKAKMETGEEEEEGNA